MSHRFLDGDIYHKRFFPKKHEFKYDFFMVDIDLSDFSSLKSKYFSINNFNIFSFFSKDHFGESDDFMKNVDDLLKKYKIDKTSTMRFITLPSMFGFVFNPISIALLLEDSKPKNMLVEVHNYNGGRVIYPVTLESENQVTYSGVSDKDMYVSPFLDREGVYEFKIQYEKDSFNLNILLKENGEKILSSNLSTKSKEFSDANIKSLLCSHTFLSLFVVTRTLWQTFKLLLKGLKFHGPNKKDQLQRI